jgi:multiple sugar transport system substrate-binding protein
MQFKRLLSGFALIMIAALVLAACGVSTQQQGGGTASSPTAAPAASGGGAASGNAVTIRWRTRPSDAAEQAVYQALNDAANQQLASKNIKAVYDPGVNQDYEPKLKAELSAGTAPDIAWIPGASVADYVAAGQALDIKPFLDKDTSIKIADFYPQPVAELTHDGKIYGLPRDVSTMVTYFNADLFKAAGIPNPKELSDQGKWNWDTLLESAKKLTDASKQQYGLGFGNWWGPAWGYFTNAAGGGMFNKERTACNLGSAESIAGAKFAQDLYTQKLVPAGDADGEALFNAGKVGMYFNGRWFTPGVRTNSKFAWDVAEMPQGKVKSTWLFWGPYIINAKTANPDAAWEVMKAITAADAMGKVAEMGTNIPSRKDQTAVDAFLKSNPPANNQAFIKGTDYAVAEQALYTGNWGDFSGKVQSLWDQMIAGKITPEDFGKQACEQTTGAFSK